MTHPVYRTVTLVGFAQIISHAGAYYLPAVMAVAASQELSLSSATVFAGLSLALIVSALAGPTAGQLVDRFGGRPVLIASNLLLATGLSLLALAQGLSTLLVAYAVLGLGMASGMFEVAFATIVRLFGKHSRNALTGVTMVAGFASVAGWTLSVYVDARYGWRGACWFWAGLNLLVALPLNALLPKLSDQVAASASDPHAQRATAPRSDTTQSDTTQSDTTQSDTTQSDTTPTTVTLTKVAQTTALQTSNNTPIATTDQPAKYTAVLLAFVFAASGFISMGLMSHLPHLLEDFGVPLAVAFSVGALVGPAQISGRILDFTFLRRMHPLVGTRIAALAHPLGIAVLVLLGAPFAALFVVLHGLGNGILIISRGTLPLVLFGAQGFGQLQGWLTMPAKLAQALAPYLFGLLLVHWGANALWFTSGLALCIFVALCLIRIQPTPSSAQRV